MDFEEKALLFVIGAFLFVTVGLPILAMFPVHYQTGAGIQTGYVSATEKSGIFFKTGRAYIKPDLTSTQEDIYCVTDDEVLKTLSEASNKKTRVEVSHVSWFFNGIAYCNGEDAAITKVESL